jgi:murein DD-endopeptidase MepM/ murein hydrolase activator NlpD
MRPQLRRRAFLAGASTASSLLLSVPSVGAAGRGAPTAALAVSVTPGPVKQGRAFLVEARFDAAEGSAGTGEALSGHAGPATAFNAAGVAGADALPLRFFQAPGDTSRFLAVGGVAYDAPLGQWFVTVNGPGGQRAETELQVVDGAFPAQRVTFAPDLLALLEPEVGELERLTIAAVMAHSAPAPLWQGLFQQPVGGRIVTTHGARRDYLDPAGRAITTSQHSGIDLAVPAGTPILAAAPGVVAFTGRWSIRGNVVVVDHGAGIHTLHAHALELLVSPGQPVVTGQPLARVGSTGLSTGPHLHWELRAGGIAVEPLEWTQRDMLAP